MGKDYNSVDDNSSPTKKGFGRSLLAKKDKKQKVYVFPYAVDINDKWKDFNKKSQAMKFANKYMLKHNVC